MGITKDEMKALVDARDYAVDHANYRLAHHLTDLIDKLTVAPAVRIPGDSLTVELWKQGRAMKEEYDRQSAQEVKSYLAHKTRQDRPKPTPPGFLPISPIGSPAKPARRKPKKKPVQKVTKKRKGKR